MDDWYILSARSNVYSLIYYCGCNDACCGYSGAVLYSKSPRFEDLAAQDCAAYSILFRMRQYGNFKVHLLGLFTHMF